MNYADLYELSVEKAEALCCPECGEEGTLEYVGATEMVCSNCGYSVEEDELQEVWQSKLEDENVY